MEKCFSFCFRCKTLFSKYDQVRLLATNLSRGLTTKTTMSPPIPGKYKPLFTYSRDRGNSRLFRFPKRFYSTESGGSTSGNNSGSQVPVWARILVVSGVGGVLYFLLRDAEHQKDIASEKTRYVEFTKAKLGGDWTLTDHHGNRRSSTDFHGQWVLIYFGFTHCPDICPEELEKLALIVKTFDDKADLPNLQPIFITLDPERDHPSAIKDYCAEFNSPRLLGFTGTEEEIRNIAKKYRVYFGKGERDENNDYIVDHTIIIYLVNPRGDFVNYFGRSLEADQICKSIESHIKKYDELEQKNLI